MIDRGDFRSQTAREVLPLIIKTATRQIGARTISSGSSAPGAYIAEQTHLPYAKDAAKMAVEYADALCEALGLSDTRSVG